MEVPSYDLPKEPDNQLASKFRFQISLPNAHLRIVMESMVTVSLTEGYRCKSQR